ncbi:IS3 family transposase [Oculatella sp. FACHB-28]|uniref:IS3 family transposase n=1 Tax=Oculatella sp. FACHB-28 TaxID=2692845 RepID=UPI001F555C52|nr:IS3 family transposase [Oculatella sp. FACHB-28]
MVMPSSNNNGSQASGVPNPEVLEKAQRRIHTAEYKLRILQETDTCNEGQIGAILRREGLYSSHLTTWRRQRQAGQLAALTDNKRGRKPTPENPLSAEVERLRRENQRLGQRLEQAELIIDIQKKGLGDLKHHAGDPAQRQQRLMSAVQQLAPKMGVAPVCIGLGVSRASYYRKQQPRQQSKPKPKPARALSNEERQQILEVLHHDRFLDQSPQEVYATLLDEGTFLCSIRTMYRILADHSEVRERRNQLRHPNYQKPELLATGPNQLWSWDITKLHGPAKWTYFYLYVILDVFSRYVVGWMVAHRESANLAERLIEQTTLKQQIEPGQLTIHADRGAAMTSKAVALLLSDLGMTKTHSRPHVSNDNPYSEAQFKTFKYQPLFPKQFGSLEDARTFCQTFFQGYNHEHHHSGIGLLTPAMLHYGQAQSVTQHRGQVLQAAYSTHPERFVKGLPLPPAVPTQAWINSPVATTPPGHGQH